MQPVGMDTQASERKQKALTILPRIYKNTQPNPPHDHLMMAEEIFGDFEQRKQVTCQQQ
jgi:hypothetical protein